MGSTFSDSGGDGPSPRLIRALARLDRLVDWERRDRSAGAGRVMRVDLGPIADLSRRLVSPERTFEVVHVAGTKGKGSTAALVALGLGRLGLTVGLYTSPHVERLQERVVVDGAPVDDELLATSLEAASEAREGGLEQGTAAGRATWFDVLTAAAFCAFRARAVDVAVVECGLGGRLDSTNVVRPRLTVLTPIEREHAAILGPTRARIAGEKAGILAPGVPAVSAGAPLSGARAGSRWIDPGPPDDPEGPPAAARALRAAASAVGTSLVDVPAARSGPLSARNLALARAALDRLGEGSRGLRGPNGRRADGTLLSADDRPGLPGRLETRWAGRIPVVLDGAHVPSSLAAVLDDLLARPDLPGPPLCVFGCGSDKDARGLLKALGPRVDRTLCTRAGPGPYATPKDLAHLAGDLGLPARAVEPALRALNDALRAAERTGAWVLVTGSLHLVGALRSATRATPC